MPTLRKLTTHLELESKQYVDGIEQAVRKTVQATTTTDQSTKAIEASWQKFGKVIKTTTKEMDNNIAAVKRHQREVNTAQRNMDRFRKEMDLAKNSIGRSAEEQEILAAQMRLGAGATDQQRQEVAELIREYNRLSGAAGQTGNRFKAMRGSGQQLQFQLQDIAVQAQMGTSAFVILGQQGPQIASLLGPMGAVIGTVIAIGSIIGGSMAAGMMSGKTAADELEKSMSNLNEIINVSGDGSTELTEHIGRLVEKFGFLKESANGLSLDLQMDANKKAAAAMLDELEKVDDKFKSFSKAQPVIGSGMMGGGMTNINFKGMTEEYKAFQSAVKALQKEVNDKSVNDAAEAWRGYRATLDGSDKKVLEFERNYLNFLATVSAGNDRIKELQNPAGGVLTGEDKKAKEAAEKIEEEIAALELRARAGLVSEEQLYREKIGYEELTKEQQIRIDTAMYELSAQKELATEEEKRLAKMKEEEAQQERLNKQGQTRLENLQQQIEKLSGIEAAEESWLTRLKATNQGMYEQIIALEQTKEAHELKLQQQKASEKMDQMMIQSVGQVASNLAQYAEEGSALAKAAFLMQQGVAAGQVMINYEAAKAKAQFELGTTAGPYLAALESQKWVSLATIAATSVAGVFHNGGTIPTDGTYLMQGGEYVESKAERREIDKLVNNGGGKTEYNVYVTNDIRTIDQLDADQVIMRSSDAVYRAVDKLMRSQGRRL